MEAGDSARPRQSDSQRKRDSEPDLESTKRRDASRLITAYRKVAYELNQMSAPAKPRKEKEEKKVFKAFITVEDEVGIKHLQARVERVWSPLRKVLGCPE
jgi:hypothetical protein